MAIDGDTAIIGHSYENTTGIYAGLATVYQNDGTGNWEQVAHLVGSNVESRDRFGYRVALDGDIAIVSAHVDELDPDGFNTGSVYMFRKDVTGTWNEVSQIVGSDTFSFSDFGASIAYNGELLVVGAPDGSDGIGSAYVFECDESGICQEVAKLAPQSPVAYLQYGRAVSIIGDQIAIGGNGEIAIYGHDENASWTWSRSIYPENLGANEHIGFYLAADGSTLAVGDVLDSTMEFTNAGAILVLKIPEPECRQMLIFCGIVFLSGGRFLRI